jgi:hypothetical protein
VTRQRDRKPPPGWGVARTLTPRQRARLRDAIGFLAEVDERLALVAPWIGRDLGPPLAEPIRRARSALRGVHVAVCARLAADAVIGAAKRRK